MVLCLLVLFFFEFFLFLEAVGDFILISNSGSLRTSSVQIKSADCNFMGCVRAVGVVYSVICTTDLLKYPVLLARCFLLHFPGPSHFCIWFVNTHAFKHPRSVSAAWLWQRLSLIWSPFHPFLLRLWLPTLQSSMRQSVQPTAHLVSLLCVTKTHSRPGCYFWAASGAFFSDPPCLNQLAWVSPSHKIVELFCVGRGPQASLAPTLGSTQKHLKSPSWEAPDASSCWFWRMMPLAFCVTMFGSIWRHLNS